MGRDQHVNAERAARLGAGIELARDVPPETIRRELDRLIAEPGFRETASAAAARIAADEPDRSAVRAVEGIADRYRGRHDL